MAASVNNEGVPKPWYIAQLNQLIATVGLPGVILLFILGMLYLLGDKAIDVVGPQVDALVKKQIEFVDKIAESNREQADSIRSLNEVTAKQVDLLQRTVEIQNRQAEALNHVHERLSKIEEKVSK